MTVSTEKSDASPSIGGTPTTPDPVAFEKARQKVVQQLLQQQTEAGHWIGKLSTSSLSTATAVSALVLFRRDLPRGAFTDNQVDQLTEGGARYLLHSQNEDGGWGDTDKSYSNIATTYLGWAALHLADSWNKDFHQGQLLDPQQIETAIAAAKQRIKDWGGIPALRRRYGTDKTFVVPILTNCALAGIVPWKEVATLPFEAAWVPQKFYRFLRLPVVSYAIPALVAIGQAKFLLDPPIWPLRSLRSLAIEPTLQVLLRMQPASGGYLEAAPLTSFVAMSLAATGRGEHPVTVNAIRFLAETVLPDGSWPIDTNLATWVTSLSVNALANHVDDGTKSAIEAEAAAAEETACGNLTVQQLMPESGWEWLMNCQYEQPHPFTGADPGAWGWTDLTGSVPDADDTPGALLALFVARRLTNRGQVRFSQQELSDRAAAGVRWLLDLQNSDGGWPTFCRGWGRLPFDRSGVDLTAHAIRALVVWFPLLEADLQIRIDKALLRGWKYIRKHQRPDGSWLPLWFGNQDLQDDENPVYGTAKTILGLLALQKHFQGRHLAGMNARSAGEIATGATGGRTGELINGLHQTLQRGIESLLARQNSDAGWGGGESVQRDCQRYDPVVPWESTIEETALAVEALSVWLARYQAANSERTGSRRASQPGQRPQTEQFVQIKEKTAQGVHFLCQRIEADQHRNSWPIGFYFAKLWYHEELYPLIFCVAALGCWARVKPKPDETEPREAVARVPELGSCRERIRP